MTSVPNCFILGLLFLFLPLTSKLKTISFPSIIRCVEILRLHAKSQVQKFVWIHIVRSDALVRALDSGHPLPEANMFQCCIWSRIFCYNPKSRSSHGKPYSGKVWDFSPSQGQARAGFSRTSRGQGG